MYVGIFVCFCMRIYLVVKGLKARPRVTRTDIPNTCSLSQDFKFMLGESCIKEEKQNISQPTIEGCKRQNE